MLHRLIRVLELLDTPGALRAALGSRRFSLAAFVITKRLKDNGVAPKTVIDVGANVGQFAIAAHRAFSGATIHPVEPDPNVAAVLRRNVPEVVASNIHVTAVGDTEGRVSLHVNKDSQVSSLLPLGSDRLASYPGSVVSGTIDVPITTLDTLFAAADLPQPILLKIDVQGVEDLVIAGARELLTKVRWVLIEVSFARLYEGEKEFGTMSQLMAQYGFRFVRPVNFHVSPKTGDIIEMDALFEAESAC